MFKKEFINYIKSINYLTVFIYSRDIENFVCLLQYSVEERKGCSLNFLDYVSKHRMQLLKGCLDELEQDYEES